MPAAPARSCRKVTTDKTLLKRAYRPLRELGQEAVQPA